MAKCTKPFTAEANFAYPPFTPEGWEEFEKYIAYREARERFYKGDEIDANTVNQLLWQLNK